MKLRWQFFMIAFCLCLLSTKALSSCFFYGVENMKATKVFTLPVSLTLSVPAGIQIGQTIYRQNINLQNVIEVYVKCTTTRQFFFAYDYKIIPLSLTSLNNKIYETGVPGIGIKFTASGNEFPFSMANAACSNTTNCHYRYAWRPESSFSLVKTSDNISAGTITGNKLPTVVYQLGQEANMVNIYQLSIDGTINITVPTCDIAPVSKNMTIQMGTHYRGDFTGINSGTGWKDASIMLINCTQFFGNSSDGSNGATFNGTSTTYSVAPNRAEVTLSPLNGVENMENGIMKISDHEQKASGIGIQLSTTRGEGGKIDFNNPVLFSLPQDGSSTLTLPLFARYIQTQSAVQSGVAKGRLEYTITYQ